MTHRIPCLRIIAAVVLLLCAVAAQSPQDTSPPTRHSMGSRKDAVGLPNFGEVTPNLYRGAQPGIDGFKTLHRMGIQIVVDMRTGYNHDEQRAVEKLGMQYVSIPWHCPLPSDEPFIKFLKVIKDNPDKKVFVHCRLGDDRTGMAIASYRMAVEGWSADEAMKEMELFGFRGIHHGICPTLAHYEKEFPKHIKSNPAFQELNAPKK
ncbi:MAG TPA: tyrosine-protein phosphatase [Dongiaceae bacterium]|nr:tyrosine-protein phosphatase [Dongiaceae bacterium]